MKAYHSDDGLMWLCSEDGFYQYDGRQFHFFERTDSIVDTEVTAIFPESKYKQWIGFSDGSIYLNEEFDFHKWNIEEGLPKVPIVEISSDSSNQLWIATYGEGIYCYKSGRLFNFNTDDGLLSNDLYCMQFDQKQEVWLGTDRGIDVCFWEDDKKKIRHYGRNEGIPDAIILCISMDQHGNIWFGTHNGGVFYFNFQENQFYNIPNTDHHGPIIAVLPYTENCVYYGTESGKIYQISLSDQKINNIIYPHIESAGISDLEVDFEGNIWVLRNLNQVELIQTEIQYLHLGLTDIQTFCFDRKENIWIGTSAGLYLYNPELNTLTKTFLTLQDQNIVSTHIDDMGHLWVGTFGTGVYVFDLLDNRSIHIGERDGLTNSSIFSIKNSGQETYLATLGGATLIESDHIMSRSFRIENLNEVSGTHSSYIYEVLIDKNGNPWFASDGDGVLFYDGEKMVQYQKAENVSLRTAYSLAEDKMGRIWTISASGQVFYIFQDQLYFYDSFPPGFELVGIKSDHQNNIIVVHSSGFFQIDGENLQVSEYGADFNLADMNTNLNAIACDQSGLVWFAGREGIFKYQTLPDYDIWKTPPVLHSVKVMDQPVSTENSPVLNANENLITFDFAGISYLHNQVNYKYQLVGYDNEWKYTRDQTVSYSKLPPGEYTFNLQSSTSQKFNDENQVTFSFRKKQAFYKHPFFIGVMVFLLYSAFYFYGRRRAGRKQKEARIKQDKITFQYNLLQSQVNPHFLFNSFNTLLGIIEEDPEVASEYVEKLSDFYRKILTYKDQSLIDLGEEIELLHDFYYLLKKRYRGNLELNLELSFTPQYQIAPMILQMLTENAIKHNIVSKKDPLIIYITEEDGYVKVSNKINAKVVPETSTGFGLKNIKERYALLVDKPVQIKREGNFFEVKIPLIKKKIHENIDH